MIRPLPELVPHCQRLLATDPDTGFPIELRRLVSDEPADAERFEAEACELKSLDHPAFLRLLRYGRAAGSPWYCVPYRDEKPLATRLDDPGLDLETRGAAVRSLAGALAAAHRIGITLDEVRLDRMVLDRLTRGVVFLHHRSSPEAAAGDPGLPPDARPGAPGSTRRDVFLWAHASYRLLAAGAPPFGANGALVPIRRRAPTLAPALAHALEASLQRVPEVRPADGTELAALLDAIPRLVLEPAAISLENSGSIPMERVRASLDELRKQGLVKGRTGAMRRPSRLFDAEGAGPGRRWAGVAGLVAAGAALAWLGPGGGTGPDRGPAGGARPGGPAPGTVRVSTGRTANIDPVRRDGWVRAGVDPWVAMLGSTRGIGPEDFKRRWRLVLELLRTKRLPGARFDEADLERLKARFAVDPAGACEDLAELLRGIGRGLDAPAAAPGAP